MPDQSATITITAGAGAVVARTAMALQQSGWRLGLTVAYTIKSRLITFTARGPAAQVQSFVALVRKA